MHERQDERGFVLVTTLVLLMIMTIMGIALFYKNQVNQDSSLTSAQSTQGYYLAEAGINYIAWVLYDNPSNPSIVNQISLVGNNPSTDPDATNLLNHPDQVANNTLGYFDINNTIGYNPQTQATNFPINMATVTTWAPPHVALDITTNVQNVPDISYEAWNNGNSFPPGNGAIVWIAPAAVSSDPLLEKDQAVTNTGTYALFAYSIGYVDGKPKRLLRAEIATFFYGFPNDLGAVSNAYK